jgi:hypothetical protein
MYISIKLRQYMSGLLLIMLASFIIASISYIANIIPETTLDITGTSTTYLPAVYVGRYDWSSRYNTPDMSGTVFYVNLAHPGQNRSYLIVAPLPPNASNRTVRVYVDGTNVTNVARNNTHVFARWPSHISNRVTITIFNAHNLFVDYIDIYSVDSRIQLPPSSSYLNNETQAISNKLIINFIGWVAGIVIVLEALRRFDLEI